MDMRFASCDLRPETLDLDWDPRPYLKPVPCDWRPENDLISKRLGNGTWDLGHEILDLKPPEHLDIGI